MMKLFVGDLPFTATDETVRALFSRNGTVAKGSLIADRETGRPRGFGFVEMSNDDGSRVIQALNGGGLDGRSLKVNEAQERERSGGSGTATAACVVTDSLPISAAPDRHGHATAHLAAHQSGAPRELGRCSGT